METARVKSALALAMVFAIVGAGFYVVTAVSISYAAASTSTDIANLTNTVTDLLVALLPLVVILLVIGFVFGMLAGPHGIFNRFERGGP